MFQNLAKFFIENGKLTLVLVIATFITGISSYFSLPKQYNPTIIVPAFQIQVNAPGLTPTEVNTYITSEVENKIMELEGIDEVYGISGEGFSGIMAKFHVGVDQEKAKIRLIQKINENTESKPLGVGLPIIKTIDPEELPQITFSISSTANMSTEEKYIYLRQIANIIKEGIKTLDNITTMDIVGGFKKDLIIEIDTKILESRNIDINNINNIIQSNNLNRGIGDINLPNGEKFFINVDGKLNTITQLEKTVIKNSFGESIYLGDIADIRYGINRIDKTSTIDGKEAVFIGFGKQTGSNTVVVTDAIKKRIDILKKELPKNINIDIIQDEGKTAKEATNMLLINLMQSILIVIIILGFALGFKNALNVAISIPLTLFSVFIVTLILGENINRISLFALILVLGMLVDDATVVVENINRHLKNRFKNGKTKLEAILIAIKEVQIGVILSTITRLLAFGSMFFVTGMMGEYMGPIPKFALIASVFSTIIALTVNPWLSYYLTKDSEPNGQEDKPKKVKRISIRKYYLIFMEKFLGDENGKKKKRTIVRIVFWLTLILVVLGPIYGGIFKARMLPKSNQNQIYIWVDAPRGWSIEKMKSVETSMHDFFKNDIMIDNISITIGQSFMDDFANLFRGGSTRNGENQLSSRINLLTPDSYKETTGNKRISSEEYTINIRPLLKAHLLEKYPDIKIQLLEDPPGPPVKSTFLAKIKGNASEKNLINFTKKVQLEVEKIAGTQNIVDVYNNFPTTYKKINLVIDHDALNNAGLLTSDIVSTLSTIISGKDIILSTNDNSLEATNIIIKVRDDENTSSDILDTISFLNANGKYIPLSSFTKKEITFVGGVIETDKREIVYSVSGEMGDNSLIYPQIQLFKMLKSDDFLTNEYKIDFWNPYEINYIGLKDGKKYTVEWGGEWELTMDTFKDLGTAMILALLGIYLLLVGQFKNFRVAGIIMIAFLLGFIGVFPGFSILYIFNNEYFSATSMIGVIALAGIVVGNSIILVEYINIMKENGLTLKDALLKAGYTRFKPIILTSLTTVLGAATIVGDPVWSGLAWAIIWGLLISSILTLIIIPIFYYDSQKNNWD
ncbi:MAG: efflux RND transporter permease subunit [Candidatus Gracilibacteria bacterium]